MILEGFINNVHVSFISKNRRKHGFRLPRFNIGAIYGAQRMPYLFAGLYVSAL
jgi:urate oxidase